MKALTILGDTDTWSEKNRLISNFLNDYFRDAQNSQEIEILEAGCGTRWDLDLDVDYVLTGVDISREAMEIRKERHNDLDKLMVGDLATVEIENEAFDAIYCSYVLEHLKDAEAVLDRFIAWLRVGGLAVLVFPDRDSVFGFIARMTPHWFHVLYYKYVVKYPHAGEPGRAPFPTFYDTIVSRRGMHQYCHDRALSVALEFAMPIKVPRAAGAIRPLMSTGIKLLAVGSLGRLTDQYQNIVMIIKKG